MSPEHELTRYRAVSAGAFLSGIVGLDLFLNFFCGGLPLVIFLFVGTLGAWLGGRFHTRLSAQTKGFRFIRSIGMGLAIFSLCGMVYETAKPINWDTKCSWRYCGRAMAPGLFKSPFPVGTPTCSGWWTCANEYQFPDGPFGYATALERMRKQGCAEP